MMALKSLTMIGSGVVVEAKNDYDDTPLHVAARRGHSTIIEVFRALTVAGIYMNYFLVYLVFRGSDLDCYGFDRHYSPMEPMWIQEMRSIAHL